MFEATPHALQPIDLLVRVIGACHRMIDPAVREPARAVAQRDLTAFETKEDLLRITEAIFKAGDDALAETFLAHIETVLPTAPDRDPRHGQVCSIWCGPTPCRAAGRIWRRLRGKVSFTDGPALIESAGFWAPKTRHGLAMMGACLAVDDDLDWSTPPPNRFFRAAQWRLAHCTLEGAARQAVDRRLSCIPADTWVAAYARDRMVDALPVLKSRAGSDVVTRALASGPVLGTRPHGLPGRLEIPSRHAALAIAEAIPDEAIFSAADPATRSALIHDALAPFYPPEARPRPRGRPEDRFSPEAEAKRAQRAARRAARAARDSDMEDR